MSDLKILHAADLHLDSAFEALPAGKAALRRSEQRELLRRLAALAQQEKVQLVVLSGDLFDSDNSYYETGEQLARCLAVIGAPVFIAPGNHDFYSSRSPWARLKLQGNIYLFTENKIRGMELPALGARVYGAAFNEKRSGPLLHGFTAERKPGSVLADVPELHDWPWAISIRPAAFCAREIPGIPGPAVPRGAALTRSGRNL